MKERKVLLWRKEAPREVRQAIEVLIGTRMPKKVEVLAYTWAGERRVSLRVEELEIGDFDCDAFSEADFLWRTLTRD